MSHVPWLGIDNINTNGTHGKEGYLPACHFPGIECRQ
jgi:hypothetical protein